MAAQAMAANGAKVYITGHRAEALDRASKWHDPNGRGKLVPAIACDVMKKYDLQKPFEHISGREKHIDVLIVAAGTSGPKAEPEHEDAENMKARLWNEETFEAWEETLQIGLSSRHRIWR